MRIFRARWLCSIGIVSYCLYLFHYPLLIVSMDIVTRMGFSRRVGAISEALLGRL